MEFGDLKLVYVDTNRAICSLRSITEVSISGICKTIGPSAFYGYTLIINGTVVYRVPSDNVRSLTEFEKALYE